MLSSYHTTAMSSIMLTSNCTPAQSEGVLVALIEEHWQAPLEQLQARSSGAPDGVLSAETAQTAHTKQRFAAWPTEAPGALHSARPRHGGSPDQVRQRQRRSDGRDGAP
jgi:hypothetical protein